MPKTTLTYLDPEADERNFQSFHVQTMQVSGPVTFEGPFVALHDKIKDKKKYYPSSRVLQVDQRLSRDERIHAVHDYRAKKKTVLFYLWVEMEDEYVVKIRNVGDRPYGLECYLIEKGDYFWKVILPSFNSIIHIPIQRIIGVDVYNG